MSGAASNISSAKQRRENTAARACRGRSAVRNHFGATVRSGNAGPFVLTEALYSPGLKTPWHQHDPIAFCLVLDGQYVERFPGRAIECRTNSVIVRPSGIEHLDEIASCGAACFFVEAPAERQVQGYHRALNASGPFSVHSTRAQWLMFQAFDELHQLDSVTPLAVEGIIHMLLAECFRLRERTSSKPHATWLCRTRDLLDDRYAEHLTLTELSLEAGVHPVHLATAFRRAFGVTIGEYVRARRVEAARSALVASDRPIAQIALEAGFSDQSHLTRVFHRVTGYTPSAYRIRSGSYDRSTPTKAVLDS